MKKELLRLHFLIAVLAFTGLLGDIIVVDAFQLVWFRTLFASIGLFAILILFKRRIKLATKNILIYLGIGITIGLHWLVTITRLINITFGWLVAFSAN